MNLYRISQNVNTGWDTYDSAVVAADSEDEARVMYPGSGESILGKTDGDPFYWDSWTSDPANVSVELIGIAAYHIERGVIVASFNAG